MEFIRAHPDDQFRVSRLKIGAQETLPFYKTATVEERIDDLRQWATSPRPAFLELSEYAVSRDIIYEGVGD